MVWGVKCLVRVRESGVRGVSRVSVVPGHDPSGSGF